MGILVLIRCFLLKMKTFDPKYLAIADAKDVKLAHHALECRKQAKLIRKNHWDAGSKGMTKDKSMRFVGRFPIEMMFHPEYKKYFDPRQDGHELRKSMKRLLTKLEDFKTVDHL